MAEMVVKCSPYIMGIDLGTSNSAIAIFQKGEAKLLPIDGKKMCPSVFRVRDNGDMVVGQQAKSALKTDPENTVASIKREIGSGWTKEFTGQPGKTYTPTDISAEILAKLVAGAQEAEAVDLRGTPTYAVICIPANFDDVKKNATKEAGCLANLDVLWLLEEPVAAAIAYATDHARDQTILVYDLGGGTFDAAILEVDSTQRGPAAFKILAKAGVEKLGGDDFDEKIMEIAAAQFKADTEIDLFDLKNSEQGGGISAKKLREAQQKLKDAAEIAKWELTEAKTAQINMADFLKDGSGNFHHLNLEITRDQFNDAIRDLILESKTAIEAALSDSKLGMDDVSRIILVGGSTKVPLVKEMLTEMFGKEPWADLDPDTVVARGAAIFGATLGVPSDKVGETGTLNPEDQPENSIVVEQIVRHYLGIETVGGKFNCLVEKGLDIPADAPLAVSKEFACPRDDMTELAIRVYQSDTLEPFVGTEGVKCIGEFFLTGIPPKPRGQERVNVTFEIDQQNLLKVNATSSTSQGDLEIKRS